MKFISVGLPCMVSLLLCLIDNISSKIVPLEKGVVIYGARYSLLYCLYYGTYKCSCVTFFPFVLIS